MNLKSKCKVVSMMMALVLAAGSLTGCSSSGDGETTAAGTTAGGASTEAAGTTAADTGADTTAADTTAADTEAAAGGDYADVITMVWYPNESAEDYDVARDEFAALIEQATGKKVEHRLTTDYAIAIESIASGSAQICFMGAQGYVEAKASNDAVMPLFVNSGASGTLDDALYYSFLAVREGDETQYMNGEEYSIDNIQGKSISFVSNSSTSGFQVPTSSIVTHFNAMPEWADLTADDLIEGGSDQFFSEVLFGGSHQGSAYNLMSGRADIAAFCDTEIAPYADCTGGEERKAGSVYTIKEDASAPFDTVTGQNFVVIQSTPVLNGPFVYNSDTLSPDDVKAIQDLFTSEEVTNNEKIFVTENSEAAGMFDREESAGFVLVEDSWYDPIRELNQ